MEAAGSLSSPSRGPAACRETSKAAGVTNVNMLLLHSSDSQHLHPELLIHPSFSLLFLSALDQDIRTVELYKVRCAKTGGPVGVPLYLINGKEPPQV